MTATPSIDPARFQVTEVIVHDVPRRLARDDKALPDLSQVESELTPDLRNYFRERIATSLAHAAFDVEFDPESSSPLPGMINDQLGARPTNFVASSQTAATHLFNCQSGNNPAGLLTVIRGRYIDSSALALLKLEREEGVRVKHETVRGRRTISLEHIRELMLTEGTKVFKAGLFVRSSDTAGTIEGEVSDKQRPYTSTTAVADFFLKRFLGCRLRERPDVTTKHFFDAMTHLINEQIEDPEVKHRYKTALHAELLSETAALRVGEFVERHIRRADRDAVRAHLRGAGIPERVPKDISLVSQHVRKLLYQFETGIDVSVPAKQLGDHVRVEGIEHERTRLTVTDRLKKIR